MFKKMLKAEKNSSWIEQAFFFFVTNCMSNFENSIDLSIIIMIIIRAKIAPKISVYVRVS